MVFRGSVVRGSVGESPACACVLLACILLACILQVCIPSFCVLLSRVFSACILLPSLVHLCPARLVLSACLLQNGVLYTTIPCPFRLYPADLCSVRLSLQYYVLSGFLQSACIYLPGCILLFFTSSSQSVPAVLYSPSCLSLIMDTYLPASLCLHAAVYCIFCHSVFLPTAPVF